MEFSKAYRERVCNDLIKLFNYDSGSAAHSQHTYFFSGEMPDHQTLHNLIRDEWYKPGDGIAKAPDNPASTLHIQYVGKIKGFLPKFSWSVQYERFSIADRRDAEITVGTLEFQQAVGVKGIYKEVAYPVVQDFDQEVHGEKALTWALTLWGDQSSLEPLRTWYVAHRVGTPLNPDAEIVVLDDTIRAATDQLLIGEIVSPLF